MRSLSGQGGVLSNDRQFAKTADLIAAALEENEFDSFAGHRISQLCLAACHNYLAGDAVLIAPVSA